MTKMRLFKTLSMAAALAAGIVGGMMVGLIGARRRQFAFAGAGSAADALPAREDHSATTGANQSFRELRRAIIGKHRRQIARVLGTPTTASLTFAAASPMSGKNAPTYWNATTWYYPFDQKQQKAIAIRFERDRAREVEFIGAPR
jgi:hypothetical protein